MTDDTTRPLSSDQQEQESIQQEPAPAHTSSYTSSSSAASAATSVGPDHDPSVGLGEVPPRPFPLAAEVGGGENEPALDAAEAAALREDPKIRVLPTRGGTPTPSRMWAAKLYAYLRPKNATAEDTLKRMLVVLGTMRHRIPPYAPPADEALLTTWLQEDGWEEEYQRTAAVRQLGEEGIQSHTLLRRALAVARQAQDVLDAAYDAAHRPEATASDYRAWVAAQRAWIDAQQHLMDVERAVRRRELEDPERHRRDFEQRRRELAEEYGGRGAQYMVLIDGLVSVEMRLAAVAASGRDISSDEFAELHRLKLTYVNQLQKYTEALKTERVVPEVRQAVLATLAIVERHLASQPVTWQAIVREVEAAVQPAATAGVA